MAITSYSTTRQGDLLTVTVVSSLTGTIYYHWYADGSYLAGSASPTRSFLVPAGEQIRVTAVDTNDPDFDPFASPPAGYPARRTLWWVASTDLDVGHYRVEQQREAEGWLEIGQVSASGSWAYQLLTPRLDDKTTYSWRLIPVDQAGNDGAALSLGSEFVVRSPDAPNLAISYDAGTAKVTLSEVA